jgi:hypothetical protein
MNQGNKIIATGQGEWNPERRETIIGLGQVFNFKLGRFATNTQNKCGQF